MGNCEHCRFWFEAPTGDASRRFGLCRRRAPVPILVGHAPPKVHGRAPEPVIVGYFPQTVAQAGCGEFEAAVPDLLGIDLSGLDLAGLDAEGEA